MQLSDGATPAPHTISRSLSIEIAPLPPPALTAQSISFTAPASGTAGSTAALSATGGGSGNPVVFTVDASSGGGVCSVAGTNGTTVSYTGAGSCVIDANQAGNASFSAAPQVTRTITVGKAASKTTLALSVTSVAWGHEKAVTFTVTAARQSTAVTSALTGTVTVSAGTKALCTGTLASGKATCVPTSAILLAPGSYGLTAAYAGNGSFAASKSPAVPLKVTKEATKTTLAVSTSAPRFGHEKSLVVTVTVTAQYSGTPAGTVTITAGKVTICRGKALSKGKATCSPPGNTTLPKGTSSLVASYSGNADFAASKSTAKSIRVAIVAAGTPMTVAELFSGACSPYVNLSCRLPGT